MSNIGLDFLFATGGFSSASIAPVARNSTARTAIATNSALIFCFFGVLGVLFADVPVQCGFVAETGDDFAAVEFAFRAKYPAIKGFGDIWDGSMIAIWNRPLSSAEIAHRFQSAKAGAGEQP